MSADSPFLQTVGIYDSSSDHTLCCPSCKSSLTHMEKVRTIRAEHHDCLLTLDATNGRVETQSNKRFPGEAEFRGLGIAVGGYCEECGAKFWLVFGQHKGETHLSWVIER